MSDGDDEAALPPPRVRSRDRAGFKVAWAGYDEVMPALESEPEVEEDKEGPELLSEQVLDEEEDPEMLSEDEEEAESAPVSHVRMGLELGSEDEKGVEEEEEEKEQVLDARAIVPLSVTGYNFQRRDGKNISFAILPFLFQGDRIPTEPPLRKLFLHGISRNECGCIAINESVIAWTLRCDDIEPEILVLSENRGWMRLLRPRRPYQAGVGRTILVTIYMLHFLKLKPKPYVKRELFHYLQNIFQFNTKPSHEDFRGHRLFIEEFFDREDVLSNCGLSETVNKIGDAKRRIRQDAQNKRNFKSNTKRYDKLCAICDKGKNTVSCEGGCLRSFHLTKASAKSSNCNSLGLSPHQIEDLEHFICYNCEYNIHQCFRCGKLGHSANSDVVNVFQCQLASCGKFYHAKCASVRIHKDDLKAINSQEKIEEGKSFVCSSHFCALCHQPGDKSIRDLQLAMCRRCPTSYHRKCLPNEMFLEDGSGKRPCDGLLYCLKHRGEQKMNHLRFPTMLKNQKPQQAREMQSRKFKLAIRKRVEYIPKKNIRESDVAQPISPTIGCVIISENKKLGTKVLNEEARSSVTLQDKKGKKKVRGNLKGTCKHTINRITPGRLENLAEAARAANKIIEDGGSLEDAMKICEPDELKLLLKWTKTLKKDLLPSTKSYTKVVRTYGGEDMQAQLKSLIQAQREVSCFAH